MIVGMGQTKLLLFMASVVLCAGCERSPLKVAGPFYLDTMPASSEVALYRCPNGPDQGCAVDGLPMQVIAAGGNKDFIVVYGAKGYYYFHRIGNETSGWGNKPEKIVGPISETEFDAARRRLNLPQPDLHL